VVSRWLWLPGRAYPSLADIIVFYGTLALTLALIPLASRRLRRAVEHDHPILPEME
jgi:hypothetical protein